MDEQAWERLLNIKTAVVMTVSLTESIIRTSPLPMRFWSV